MFCHIFLFGVGSNQRGEAAIGGLGNRQCGHFWRALLTTGWDSPGFRSETVMESFGVFLGMGIKQIMFSTAPNSPFEGGQ